MKKLKKVFAVLLSVAMILGMSGTVFAAEPTVNANANGSSNDSVQVSITGITGNPTVTLYRIAKGEYSNASKNAFKDYSWAKGLELSIIEKIKNGTRTADDVTTIVNGLKADPQTITPFTGNENGIVTAGSISGDTYTATVNAGAYIAVISGAIDGTIYNPILLTASYNEQGQFVGGNVDTSELYGTNGVAKKTTPDVKKEITGGTTEDTTIPDTENQRTAAVGDVIDYAVTPTVPQYPSNAKNKTLFVKDTMSPGLDYLPTSLKIEFGDQALKADDDGNFMAGTTKVASVVNTDNGFNLNFVYDAICDDTGVPYANLKIKYSARVNENAVVGTTGNPNDVKMYYANDPTTGSTFEPSNDKPTPDGAEGVTKKEDKKIVYTYQLGFKKVDQQTKDALANAVFGIYEDKDCTKLVDIVKTNEAGYGVSTSVAAKDYYVKEIEAPEGYSLNDTVYGPYKPTWEKATTIINREETTIKYTDNAEEAATKPAVQAGWIFNGKFYTTKPAENAMAAYVKETTTTKVIEESIEENKNGGGTLVFDKELPNTNLSALPSTGGIGTIIFTVGGCLIMVVAAALYFANRRKAANSESK